jgi:hypothetical protein
LRNSFQGTTKSAIVVEFNRRAVENAAGDHEVVAVHLEIHLAKKTISVLSLTAQKADRVAHRRSTKGAAV